MWNIVVSNSEDGTAQQADLVSPVIAKPIKVNPLTNSHSPARHP
jgi:hypothetical protein